MYYLCMLPSFWAGHLSVVLIVCMFFSHPYLSLNMLEVAAIGLECVQILLSKVFGDQVSSSSTVLLLFYSTFLAPKVPPIETKTLN